MVTGVYCKQIDERVYFEDGQVKICADAVMGLSALILGENGVQQTLPLTGLPREIYEIKDPDQLEKCLSIFHFYPEKGVSGDINRFSAKVPGVGGGYSGVTSEPGLNLGAVLDSEVLGAFFDYESALKKMDKIEREVKLVDGRMAELDKKIAEQDAEIAEQDAEIAEQDAEIAEQDAEIAEQDAEIAEQDEKHIPKTLEFMRKNFWKMERKALRIKRAELIKAYPSLCSKKLELGGFALPVESPIEWKRSEIVLQERGFDSLTHESEYVDTTVNSESIRDKAFSLGSSNSVSANVGACWIGKANLSQTFSGTISRRLLEIDKESTADGVFMVQAKLTSRNVRMFSEIHYDTEKLKSLLAWMESTNRNNISILTEFSLGGSFVALVTFVNEEKLKRKREQLSADLEMQSRAGGNVNLPIPSVPVAVGGDLSSSSKFGLQSESDALNQMSKTKINIEFHAMGAIPSFSRQILEREVTTYLSKDPKDFSQAPLDATNVKNMLSKDSKKKEAAVLQRHLQIESAQIASLNTVRRTIPEKRQLEVHTIESVMEAYDSYLSKMRDGSASYVPIEFSTCFLTKDKIKALLKMPLENKEKLSRKNVKQSEKKKEKPEQD